MKPPTSNDSFVSKVMKANKPKNTSPEREVRKALCHAGYKGYRLNWANAPGKPDVAFVRKKIAILIDGCFWHGCRKCKRRIPKTNPKYWIWKIDTNRDRDKRNTARLKRLGWHVYRFWEHDMKKNNYQPLLDWLMIWI